MTNETLGVLDIGTLNPEQFRKRADDLAAQWTDGLISDLEYIAHLTALMMRVG